MAKVDWDVFDGSLEKRKSELECELNNRLYGCCTWTPVNGSIVLLTAATIAEIESRIGNANIDSSVMWAAAAGVTLSFTLPALLGTYSGYKHSKRELAEVNAMLRRKDAEARLEDSYSALGALGRYPTL